MTNGLIIFQLDAWPSDAMKDALAHTSLSNAKQLIVGSIRDEVIVDLAANTPNDLNVALLKLSGIQGVKQAVLVRVING